MTAAMNKRILFALITGMAPGVFSAQDVYESCENLPVALAVDVPLEISADSAQWFLNEVPVGPLEIEPLASEWYDPSLEVDESGIYDYVVWFTDAEGLVQDSLLGSWQVTVWATLGFNSVADTFALCAIGDTQLELGAATGGSGNFDWTWTALGPNDTLVVDLPPSLSQTWGPQADSAQWALSITDLEGCGSITPINWTFEVQDTLDISLGGVDGNGINGSWCHGQSIDLSATAEYSEYIWTWVDDLDSVEVVSTIPTWTTPLLTTESTVYVRATTDNGCSTATDALTLSVLEPIEAPVIAPLTAICNGGNALISLEQGASPSELDWSYTWVEGEAAVLGTGSSIQVNDLTSDLMVSVEATSTEGCGSVVSEVAVQPVFETLSPPVIALTDPAFPDTACYGSSDFELFITEEAAPDMAFTYQWYINDSPVDAGIGGTSVPFNTTLTEEIEIYVTATSANGCGQASSSAFVQPVFPDLVAPQIAPSSAFNADTLCFGTSGFTLIESSPAASNMAFSYSWMVDGTELSGENDPSLVLPALEATTTIQLEVTSENGCGTMASNAWYQPVFAPISSPVIEFQSYDPADTLCNGDDGPVIVQQVSPLDEMAFTYEWLSSTGINSPAVYPSTNNTQLDVSILTETTAFAIEATSVNGCGTYVSNFIEVPVFPMPQAPVIDFSEANPTLPICFGTQAPDLEMVTPPAVGMAFEWQWLNGANLPINGANTTVLVGAELESAETYALSATSMNGCGTWASNEVLISVWPAIEAGLSSAAEDVICFETSATMETEGATGGNGEFEIEWLAGPSANELSPVSGSNESPWTTSDLAESTWFAPLFTSASGCGQIEGDAVFIEVLPEANAGTLSAPDSICFDSSAQPLMVSEANGADGQFSTLWYANNGSGWTQVQQGNNSYAPGNLTETTTFRCDFVSDFGCGTYPSNEVEVYVFEEVQAGTILVFESPICFGFDGDLIATAETSGENITYQWEASSNDADWSLVAGENDLDLVLNDQTATGFYRLQYLSEDGCPSDVTASVEFEVYPELQAPVINGLNNEDAFCYGFEGPNFETTQPANGANESFNSFWQFSPSGMIWSNVSSAPSYTPNSVTQSGHYRLTSTSTIGCGTVASNSVFVTVLPAITPSVIEGAQTLCFMEAGTDLVGNATTGADGNFTYQWIGTTDGTSTPLAGEDNTTLAISGLPETTLFTLQVTSTYGCGVVESNPVEVFVWDELIPGSLVEVADTACFGWALVIEATPVVSGQNISTQWNLGSNGGLLDEAPAGAVDLTWNIESLESSTHFAISYTSGNGCGTVWSDTALVTVLPAVVHPEIELETGGADSICYNTLPPQFLQASEASGANDAFSYLWQIQLEGSSSWTSINNAPEGFLDLPAQILGFMVRQVASDVLCGSFHSNELGVHVFEPFVPATLEGEQLICYGTAPDALSAVGPTGGGDHYQYEWSTMSAVDTILIAGENNSSLEIPDLVESTTYLLETTSNYGCGSGWSNPLAIEVADSLIAGSFDLNPLGELCSGEEVSALGTDATGGIGPHEWNWWMGEGDSWQVVGTDLDLAPIQLTDTVKLTLLFSNQCGNVSSDTTTVIVNPLPPLSFIEGDLNPCTSSVANYLCIGNFDPAIDYTWTSNSSSVEITSGESGPAILFDHGASSEPLQFQVTLEYIATGCISDSTFSITPSSNEAPPLGFVEQKPGLEVLVCSDSTDCAQYQWGILNPETNAIHWLQGENEQYLYYEGLEDEPGIFCVEVVYDCGDGVVSCPTLMYWNYTPFLNVDDLEGQNFVVFPNPFTDALHLSGTTAQAWYLFDSFGRLVCESQHIGTSWNPDGNLERGAYMLIVRTDKGSRRTIVLHQ